MPNWIRHALLAFAFVAGACEDTEEDGDEECEAEEEEEDEEAPIGPPSGATCPTDNTLTYENFGKPFMEMYCTRCHSSTLTTPEQRMCAPAFHDFDTLQGILPVAEHIDQFAAAGPSSTNTEMPENGPAPTLEEREQLGQWLACELAAM